MYIHICIAYVYVYMRDRSETDENEELGHGWKARIRYMRDHGSKH